MISTPSLLFVAALTQGCDGRTTLNESEQLAQAFRARMLSIPLFDAYTPFEDDDSDRNRYHREASIYQTRFLGVQRGVGLDRELSHLADVWWGSNVAPAIGSDLPHEEFRLKWLQYQNERSARFGEYARGLRERIEADSRDTAARGMLATATLALGTSDFNATWGYPNLSLLAVHVLDISPPQTPFCATHSDDVEASLDLFDCLLDVEERAFLVQRSRELALTWVDQIAEVNPDSTWIDVARLLAVRGDPLEHLPVFDSSSMELSQSRSTNLPSMGHRIILGTDSLMVDSAEVLKLQEMRFSEESWRHDLLVPLYEHLRYKFVDMEHAANNTGRDAIPGVQVLVDRRHRYDELQAVLFAAEQAGFVQFELLALGEVGEHVVKQPSLVALHTQWLSEVAPSHALFFDPDTSVEQVIAAMDEWHRTCEAAADCDPEVEHPVVMPVAWKGGRPLPSLDGELIRGIEALIERIETGEVLFDLKIDSSDPRGEEQ
jgi:hypothetical protein